MGHVASDRTMQQEPASDYGTTWNPFDAIQGGACCEYAVIVLNCPIFWKPHILLQFWRRGCILSIKDTHVTWEKSCLFLQMMKTCKQHCQFMYLFMQAARVTVTVDGGTQRWLKYLEEQGIDVLNGEHERYVPDLITGDMDSSSPSIIEKLGNIGSTIVKTPDQNYTDYTKALLQVANYTKTRNINVILWIFVATSKLMAVYNETNNIFGS